MQPIPKPWKGIISALGAGLMLASSQLTDGKITNVEWLQIALAVVTAFQVWYFANTTVQPRVKAELAGLAAGLQFLIGILPDHHLTHADLVNLAIAVLVAAGVIAVNNGPAEPQPAAPVDGSGQPRPLP